MISDGLFEDVASSPNSAISYWLRAAHSQRPDTLFARWGADLRHGETATALERLAEHYAARLHETRPGAGGTAVVVATPEPKTLALVAATHRVGLNVALAPPTLEEDALVEALTRSEATMLAGPAEFAGLPLGERLFRAAGRAPRAKVVALHGGEPAGAFALDAPLEETPEAPPPISAFARMPRTLQADARTGETRLIDDEPTLRVAADLSARAAMRPGDVIVSLISPASPAGLVAGVFAPLLSGAHLIWQAPFAASLFAEAIESAARIHLVAPIAAAPALMSTRLLESYRLISLTWIGEGEPNVPVGLLPSRVFTLPTSFDETTRARSAAETAKPA